MDLFPPIEPYHTAYIAVPGGHALYVEQSGNPDGIPLVFIHGGPGEHCDADDRQLYDPEKWRIILYDQRGCGKSMPFGGLDNNTFADLVDDLEYMRSYLNIDQRVIHGGSRGSTIGLAYAQHYPEHCLTLILNSLYLFTEAEHAYVFGGGYREFFPELRTDLLSIVPVEHHHDLRPYLFSKFLSEDTVNRELLRKLIRRLGAGSKYLHDVVWDPEIDESFISSMRIYLHFVAEASGYQSDILLQGSAIDRIRHIPTVLIHGRYDLCCPYALSTYKLSQLWPEATIKLIEGVGHRTSEKLLLDTVLGQIAILGHTLSSGNQ